MTRLSSWLALMGTSGLIQIPKATTIQPMHKGIEGLCQEKSRDATGIWGLRPRRDIAHDFGTQ